MVFKLTFKIDCSSSWACALRKKIQGTDNISTFDPFISVISVKPKYEDHPANGTMEDMAWVDLGNDIKWSDAIKPVHKQVTEDLEQLRLYLLH